MLPLPPDLQQHLQTVRRIEEFLKPLHGLSAAAEYFVTQQTRQTQLDQHVQATEQKLTDAKQRLADVETQLAGFPQRLRTAREEFQLQVAQAREEATAKRQALLHELDDVRALIASEKMVLKATQIEIDESEKVLLHINERLESVKALKV